jgi:hypothetical protein
MAKTALAVQMRGKISVQLKPVDDMGRKGKRTAFIFWRLPGRQMSQGSGQAGNPIQFGAAQGLDIDARI